MKPALLLLAHGSPLPAANLAVERVRDELRATGEYLTVLIGYLDCNSPTIPEALDQAAAAAPGTVIAVPYFLHPGRHVAHDLPDLLEAARRRHPRVEFLLGDYLGLHPAIGEVLMQRFSEAPLFDPSLLDDHEVAE